MSVLSFASVPWFPHSPPQAGGYFTSAFSPQATSYYPSVPDNVDTSLTVTVTPLWWRGVYVQWFPSPTANYKFFNVYHSPSENGPFIPVNRTPIAGYATYQINSEMGRKFNQEYYYVEAYGPSGNVAVSPLVTWMQARSPALVQNAALDITRREWVFLSKLAGVPVFIFKRKIFGPRCPRCWSYEFQKLMMDHCDTCYNTSFEGGYFDPVYTLAQFDALTKQQINNYFGVFEPNNLSAWTINFPIIQPHDLVYRVADARMFRVEAIETTEMQAQTLRQILKLVELDKEMVEYHLTARLPTISEIAATIGMSNPWLNPS